MSEGQEVPQPRWDNTVRGVDRVRRTHPQLFEEPSGEAPNGVFAGRRIIGRDTIINGGVYVGSGQREAIVVDDQKYSLELGTTYQELRQKMELESRKPTGHPKIPTFQLVHEIAGQKLGGNKSESELEQQIAKHLQALTGSPVGVSPEGIDVKVTLNDFINKGAGVCRHRALLAGYLIERLIQDGVMQGRVSIDRNTIPSKGGHAWVRYEGPNRHVFIIDPSIGYWGPIEKAPKVWSYKRPGEK